MDRGVRLEPPKPRRANLVRPRLLNRLRDRFATPVTVLVAPAGFGKTTLLAQAVAENRLTPRGVDFWLTCSADDIAGSSLAEGLCRTMDLTPPGGTLERATDAVVEAMWHRSPGEVAVLLDDVHEIPPGSSGAEVLARLVAALPRNGHFVLSGRQSPPIPLSRLEVQGQVLRVEEADLCFTEEELSEFATRRRVSAGQLLACGGWPALAELAASAVPGVESSYMWEEVLAKIDPERRRDLALLAHVGSFDEELATATLGNAADVAALTAELPLVTTTPDGARQIHSLWLPHLAKAASPDEIAHARRRAGTELAKAGDVPAAVRLFTEAGAWSDVTSIVADTFGAAYPPVAGDVVAAWLGRLPDDMAEGPLARLLGAVGAVQTNPVAATRDLQEAADAFRHDGDDAGELACMAQLAQIAWWSEQPERLLQLAARLFEMEALGHDRAAPLACVARALIADVAADAAGVLVELDRVPAGSLSPTLHSFVDWLRSTSLHHLGRPAEALEAAERACAKASPLHAPLMASARIQARWFLGQLDAMDEMPSLVEGVAATGLRDYTSLMAAACCTVLATMGRAQAAATYLERARSAAASPGNPLVDANLVIAEAALAIASGDEPRAARVLREYLDRSAPLGTGLAAFPQRRSLTLWYMLIPQSREMWDAVDLGPAFVTARDLARALVAVRSDGRLPPQSPPLPAANVARAFLPQPWATELALGSMAAGQQEGWALLDALWPQAQPDVRRYAADTTAPLSRPARAALTRLPVPPAGHLEVKLLGPVELRRNGALVDVPEWRRERVRSLLAHLVLHRPVDRERLAADLWPNLDAEARSRNLRVTLTHLLRVLEPDRADRDASFLVRPHGGALELHQGEWLVADIWLFDDLWRRAIEADSQGIPSTALDAMQQAVALWRSNPNELASVGWALPEVEERRRRLVTLATRAGELLLARGEPDAARLMGEVALRSDRWSERSHHVVIGAHAAAGQSRAAHLALQRYREALDELGMAPADVTHKLEPFRRLLAAPAKADTGTTLTRREREVAELVGAGLTNVEIAARLFISKRTVESHVDHIKQKLAFSLRSQIIAWAVGRS